MVGYGAEPDACTELVRERCEVCLVGNHDLAVLGALDVAAFSETGADGGRAGRGRTPPSRRSSSCAELEPAGPREGFGLFHASPRDPIWEYVLSVEQADACLDVQAQRICLIGHSHVALFFTRPPAGRPRSDASGAQSG